MDIVAAGVRYTGLPAEVRSPLDRFKGQVRLFGDREGVHVRPDSYDRTRPPPAQDADHPGLRNTGPHFQPEALELARHDAGGAGFSVPQFRVPVQIVPNLDQLRNDPLRGSPHIGLGRLGPETA
jgi:hypothetical protein